MGVAVTGNGTDVGAGVSPSHAETGMAGMSAMRTHRATVRPYGFAVRLFPLKSRELLYLTSRDRAEDYSAPIGLHWPRFSGPFAVFSLGLTGARSRSRRSSA